jgi:uncharacterized Zn finger protein
MTTSDGPFRPGPRARARDRSPARTPSRSPENAHRSSESSPARSRTLPALPPRPGSRGPFAESWWGDAWVRALEESALEAGRLSRGRAYARGGYVDAITVMPGRVTAPVHGTRPRPYLTTLRLPTLTDREWNGFLDAVSARPAHIAALLDKEMPHQLAEAAHEAGVRLLPGHGELRPSCSCPDIGHPCKHAAALCYQTARFLDSDPFVLLLLRGRDEDELLDELSRRNALLTAREAGRPPGEGAVEGPKPGSGGTSRPRAGAGEEHAAEPGAALPGVLARDALATSVRPALPAPLAPPPSPGVPPPYPELPGAPGPDDLAFLAAHAATRAHAALTDSAALAPSPLWHDAVRLAATHPQLARRGALSTRFAALADATGRRPRDLMRAAAAWRQGGEEGLALLEGAWDPPAGDFDRAHGALAAADLPRMSPWRNRLTDARHSRQLRYGHDGRWYPYREVEGTGGDWWPAGPAEPDPVAALTGMLEV